MGRVISLKQRRYIEAQGFLGLDEIQIAQLDGWLRFSPAVCMAWTAIGVYLASTEVIAALIPFAFLGGVLRGHPFDAVYNYGLRFVSGGPRIPPYGNPRRFGCLMAAVVLSLTAASFAAGVDALGYLLGAVMVSMAGINVTTGFCVPSHLYGKLFGKASPVGEAEAVGG